MKTYRLNANLRGFTVGRVYTQITENVMNVSLRDDDGEVQYVAKTFLIEVMG